MFPALTAFSLSFLVLSVLILHKIWEMNKGHSFFSKAVLPKSDSLIKKHIEIHKEVIVGGSKRGWRALSSITKESLKHLLLVCAHYLQDKSSKVIVKIKGKNVKHKSGVSFFLKRMEGYKKEKGIKQALPEVNDVEVKSDNSEGMSLK